MQVAELIKALRVEGHALADSAVRAGLTADVSSCPGWQVKDVVGHVGGVHRWATANVLAARDTRWTEREDPPANDVIEWYREGHTQLLDVLTSAPVDLRCWTFLEAPSPLAFWARRQAHETAIHRADCDQAAGAIAGYSPEFAIDGIAELLLMVAGRHGKRLTAEPIRSLLVTPNDSANWWQLTIGPGGRELRTEGAQQADCVLRGSASDLYLWLWNRQPVSEPDIKGDAALVELWQDLARV